MNRKFIASINVYLSMISLACLLISLLIFSFKSLQCDRLKIHRNLMVSLALYGLLTITQFLPYIRAPTSAQTVWWAIPSYQPM